ncbi:MAG: glycoside hydrolase family 2, partial [Acutalibacteraceae bacterium]
RDDLLEIVYRTTKQLDPSRPCIDTSGNFHVVTDIYDVHDYEQNPEIFKVCYDKLVSDGTLHDNHSKRQQYNGEPTFVSEYGGIKWVIGNSDSKAWGYGNAPKTEEEFIERYRGLTDALLDNECMFGFCYTQLYDIEQEQNGLYTYSREPKFDMEIFRKINSRKAAIEK